MAAAKQQQRAERILDAAAELVLRWGYKRVSIEEVARHAGIGKGTVYLHFSTRAALFMCVLMRESLGLVDGLVAAMRADPAAILPAEQARVTYLAVMGRPLLRAMFTGDVEVLGELAGDSAGQPLRKLKIDLADELFELLRDRGLMRTDLDAETQRYVLNAVQAGFYLYPPAAAPSVSPQMAAAALAHVVRHAVQPPGPPDTGTLAALAPQVIAMYERFRRSMAIAVTGDAPVRLPS
ncbi:MAG TPA: helix-turn-helix domain-containing protein [Pseudonocardiaceae bacterium]|nr:helix-turn-helix domain-containing protein [Pseudonocardiaceae bacterium]